MELSLLESLQDTHKARTAAMAPISALEARKLETSTNSALTFCGEFAVQFVGYY